MHIITIDIPVFGILIINIFRIGYAPLDVHLNFLVILALHPHYSIACEILGRRIFLALLYVFFSMFLTMHPTPTPTT